MAKNTVKKEVAQAEPEQTKAARAIVGTVTSDKMDKTIVVQVLRMVKHPVYGKYMRRYSKMYVHDVDNKAKTGDVVKIKQTRPMSKLKSYTLVEIVRQAELGLEALENEKE